MSGRTSMVYNPGLLLTVQWQPPQALEPDFLGSYPAPPFASCDCKIM